MEDKVIKANKIKKLILIPAMVIVLLVSYYDNIVKLFSKSSNIDDYYLYINNETLKDIKLDENRSIWATVNLYQEEVDNSTKEITSNLIKSKTNKNMNIIYDNYMDVETRNKLGVKPLQGYIDRINNSKDINSLLNNIYDIENKLSVSILMNIKISKDFKDSNKNIVYLYPLTFDFNLDSFMYADKDYLSYTSTIQKYMIRLLKEYKHIANPVETANKILEMKKDVASKSKTSIDLENISSLYNIIEKGELQSIYTNIDLNKYLNAKGINNQTYSIVDRGNYEAFNDYLTNDNLELLKNYFSLRLIESYADVLSENYTKIITDLSNDLSNEKENNTLEDDAIHAVQLLFSDVIDNEFAKNSLTDENKETLNKLIDDILVYYEDNFKSLDWMGSETKNKAINKLKNIKRNIGYTSEIISDNYPINSKNNLFENVVIISKYVYNDNLKLLSNPDKKVYPIGTTVVNAFYDPQENSISFPCAAYKFMKDDYYENLGSIGFIVAHEITHAFDNNGSKFNEKGEFENWWTDKDLNSFKKLTDKVVDYYGNYKVNGIEVNGEKTLGENIADLGAIKCITSIANKNKASEEDYKKMYSSFAKFAAMKALPEVETSLILMDTHSPNSVRINATLSSNDKFYEIYKISEDDDMYVDKNERVKVW